MKDKYLLSILFLIGAIFLRSSWGKISGGVFVNGLGASLDKFASKNPYPFVQSFLKDVAIPNATTFGFLTMWGEFFVALALSIGTIGVFFIKSNKLFGLCLFLGCLGGMFLNLTFYLAAGYTSPSTDGLNILMFGSQLVGLLYSLKILKS